MIKGINVNLSEVAQVAVLNFKKGADWARAHKWKLITLAVVGTVATVALVAFGPVGALAATGKGLSAVGILVKGGVTLFSSSFEAANIFVKISTALSAGASALALRGASQGAASLFSYFAPAVVEGPVSLALPNSEEAKPALAPQLSNRSSNEIFSDEQDYPNVDLPAEPHMERAWSDISGSSSDGDLLSRVKSPILNTDETHAFKQAFDQVSTPSNSLLDRVTTEPSPLLLPVTLAIGTLAACGALLWYLAEQDEDDQLDLKFEDPFSL